MNVCAQNLGLNIDDEDAVECRACKAGLHVRLHMAHVASAALVTTLPHVVAAHRYRSILQHEPYRMR